MSFYFILSSLLFTYDLLTKISSTTTNKKQERRKKKKMGRRCFVMILLVAALLSISFSQAYGRRVKVVRHYGSHHQHVEQQQHNHEKPEPEAEAEAEAEAERVGAVGRQTATVETTTMDYEDPKANTNPRNGAIFNPPPSPPAPPHFKH